MYKQFIILSGTVIEDVSIRILLQCLLLFCANIITLYFSNAALPRVFIANISSDIASFIDYDNNFASTILYLTYCSRFVAAEIINLVPPY